MNHSELLRISKQFIQKNIGDFNNSDKEKLSEIISLHGDLYYNEESPVISDSEYDDLFKKLSLLKKKSGEQISLEDKVGENIQSTFQKVAHSRPMISLDNTYNADELRDFDVRIKRILRNKIIHGITPPVASDIPLCEGELNQVSLVEGSRGIELCSREGCPGVDAGKAEGVKIPYTIEFKFDGLGIELVYEEGKLVQAITRGNGVEGEDVTENVKQIKNIPHKIDATGRFEVRGEVVMPISSFERLNKQALEKGEKVFSDPRNAASGSLRVLDTDITKKRDLKYFAYDVSDFEGLTQSLSTQHLSLTLSSKERGQAAASSLLAGENGERCLEQKESVSYSSMIHHLESLGFEISSYFPECSGIDEVVSHIDNIGDIKSQIDFEIDGLVVKVNDIALWKKIGSTEHHPRYAISYKFPAEIVTTKLESVEHSVGRTGTITPVANLEAVNISGAMIRRATLHNYDEVEKLGVKVGDYVFLKRAGEVIPKITAVATHGHGTAILPPEFCPSCGEKVMKDDEKVRYYCPNSYGCPAQMKEKIAFAVGKQGFNIDGFGEKQAELFYSLGYIQTFADIFRLKNHKQEILDLEGFQEKSVNNLLEGIEEVRSSDIVTFLKSLGIPGVGKKTAKIIGNYLLSQKPQSGILSPLEEKGAAESLQSLNDIGPEVASSVIQFFRKQRDIVNDLLLEITILLPLSSEGEGIEGGGNGKWQGKKICITGSFEGYKREKLAEILEKQGGEFMSSVSKKTDYLLAGEKAGSKLKKAQELGVEVLSLEEFL